MVQYIEKFKKNIAMDMRKRGFSYSEIQQSIQVPKSTLSFWFRDLKLSDFQTERLHKKRDETARTNAHRRILRIAQDHEEIKSSAAHQIGKISKRELWLMGIMLYHSHDSKQGVHFMSGDSTLIQFFIQWLKDVGNIRDEEIVFDIFIEKEADVHIAVKNWAKITGFRQINFTTVYYIKKKGIRKISTQGSKAHGYLRVRVKASSLLARQIHGWRQGVYQNINNSK